MSAAVLAAPERATPRSAEPGRTVLLLGPQRKDPVLAQVLESRGIDGRVAAVTAGWQEREAEIDELQEHLGGRSVNLELHRRADQAFQSDPDLADLHHARQEELRALQRLYDVRLRHAIDALVELERRESRPGVIEAEREAALETVRAIDARHLERVRAIHEEWAPRLDLDHRPALVRHRHEVAAVLRSCSVLAIAGGHVAVLLNRLRLLGIPVSLPRDTPVVGWSAGAMVLTERIVVYHDSPPQGFGNAEVLESGLGLARGIVALPHARARLRLDDPDRVSRFARRFAPARCIALEREQGLVLEDGGWAVHGTPAELAPDGSFAELSP